jgi:hypothetical protein
MTLFLEENPFFLRIYKASNGVGEMRNAYKILVGKHEGERPIGKPRCRLENNIRIDLRKIGWGYVNWIYLAQD